MLKTYDIHVRATERLPSPRSMKSQLAIAQNAVETVVNARETITKILAKSDSRPLVIAGPCSIHDPAGALEYAHRLNRLRLELSEYFYIVMRVYFEKPRTTVGWKGLINDPYLDGTYDIHTGLKEARKLLIAINEMGLPAATEFLDPIIPQYIDDLISWAAIGARTTESQTHREMASGLSMPVGFKNGTDGSLQTAIDALYAAKTPHSFLGIDEDGYTSVIRTTGNPAGHLVLRGGRSQPNYDESSIQSAVNLLVKAGLPAALMVDCSHANSKKQYERQEIVWKDVLQQKACGNQDIIGCMLESNLHEGNQPIPSDQKLLKYGVSVTDACISWETTERLLKEGTAILHK